MWVSSLGTISTGRVAMCSSRLATLPSRMRGRSVRLLHMATRPVLIVPREDTHAGPAQASAVAASAGADQG